jgi:L-rhamnose-H+ transport protein
VNEVTFGFLLILLAAAMNGAFAIPMKFLSRWKWENTWLVWSMLSLWLLPWILLWIFVPHPMAAYQQTPGTTLALIAVVGLAWGTGVLLFGESFPHVGVAVGTAVGLGCASAVGAILPVLSGRASSLPADSASGISLGVATALVGVAMCGVAGRAREKRLGIHASGAGSAIKGFLYAGVGGSINGSPEFGVRTQHANSGGHCSPAACILFRKHCCLDSGPRSGRDSGHRVHNFPFAPQPFRSSLRR